MAPAPIPARTARQRHDRPQQERDDGHAHAGHSRSHETRSVELRHERLRWHATPYHPIDSRHERLMTGPQRGIAARLRSVPTLARYGVI